MEVVSPELFDIICCELSQQDLKNLRLTCRHYADYLASQLFRSLRFNINSKTVDRNTILRFNSLATPSNTVSAKAEHLIIELIAPTYDPTAKRKRVGMIMDDRVARIEDAPPTVEQIAVNKQLERTLGNTLCSLQGLQSLTWTPSLNDSLYVEPTILRSLHLLPKLSVLDLDLSEARSRVDLSQIHSLNALRITRAKSWFCDVFYDSLSRVIANSPNLTTLSIDNGVTRTVSDEPFPPHQAQSLHHLFKHYPCDSEPLKLRTLILSNTLVRFDDVTLPHLSHLRVLDLTNCIDPTTLRNDLSTYFGDTFPVFSTESEAFLNLVGQSDGQMWESLRASAIELESIRHDRASRAFFQYLSFCPGLKSLWLEPRGFKALELSDAAASLFFAKSPGSPWSVIAPSLEVLSIVPPFEGDWCFGGKCFDEEKLAMCQSLKHLDVSIMFDQLAHDIVPKSFVSKRRVWNSSTMEYPIVSLGEAYQVDARKLLDTELPQSDVIKRLLDTCAPSRHLKTLAVVFSNQFRPNPLQAASQRIPINLHHGSCETRAGLSLRRYKAPSCISEDSPPNLPILNPNGSKSLLRKSTWLGALGELLPSLFASGGPALRAVNSATATKAILHPISMRSPNKWSQHTMIPVWDRENGRVAYSPLSKSVDGEDDFLKRLEIGDYW